MPSRSPTRLAPRERRAQILDAAASVLDAHAPDRVTFEQVADAAGVSRGLVYNYFHDRGGLLAALYERSVRPMDDGLIDVLGGPVATLPRRMVACVVDYVRTHPEAWPTLRLASCTRHPAVLEARRRRIERFTIQWGGGPATAVTVRAVFGMVDTALVDTFDAGDADVDHVEKILVILLEEGLAGMLTPKA